MSRNAFYFRALDALPEPATLMEIQFQAIAMYGNAVKPTIQSVRSSVERFVALKKVTRMIDGDGVPRYWITGKSMNAEEHLLAKMVRLNEELRAVKIELASLSKKPVDNATSLGSNTLEP